MYDHVAWLMDGQGFALELRDEMAKTTWLIARILKAEKEADRACRQ